MKREDLKNVTFEDAGDIDLDHDDHGFTNPDGTRLTEADLTATDEELAQRTKAVKAMVGRPSLTGPGKVSPTVNARVSLATKNALKARASARGLRESDLVREAVEQMLSRSHPQRVAKKPVAKKAVEKKMPLKRTPAKKSTAARRRG